MLVVIEVNINSKNVSTSKIAVMNTGQSNISDIYDENRYQHKCKKYN
jgi:hypothetical protein